MERSGPQTKNKCGKNAVKYKAPVVIEAEQNPQC